MTTQYDLANGTKSRALLSECGTYRYRLSRQWTFGAFRLAWVMLNPSTADAEQDDPTIRRCMGFARAWGYGGIVVVNLFALRATDPRELRHHADPVGVENDEHIRKVARDEGAVVCAWGAHPFASERAAEVLRIIRANQPTALCLGTTKGGAPRHPLYVKGTTELVDLVEVSDASV
jgi:hypothetical protein